MIYAKQYLIIQEIIVACRSQYLIYNMPLVLKRQYQYLELNNCRQSSIIQKSLSQFEKQFKRIIEYRSVLICLQIFQIGIEYYIQFLFYLKIKKMAQYSAQILKTLSDQIQNLSPLRESFKHLQAYYCKLTNQFNDLLTFGERSQTELLTKLRYLEQVHRELEYQFSGCGQQLRQAQCEQAKHLMETKQQIAQCEATKSRQQLELGQKTAFENKRKDLLQHNSKLQFNVTKYKELIHNLQLVIKSKQYENIDIERQIKKLELVNSKITQLNRQKDQNIDSTHQANEKIVEQLHQLQDKLQTYSKLISAKEKLNRQNVQTLITKTEELQQLKHRKQYIEKLLQTEDNTQKELMRNYGEIDSILNIKREKLQLVQQQNHQYENAILEEKNMRSNSKDELDKLANYLQTLVQTNEILFRELERSCTSDREVQVMLSQKLEKLLVVNDKITENQMFNRFDHNSNQQKKSILGFSKSNSQTLQKDYQNNNKFVSNLAPLTKKNLQSQKEERVNRSRDQQMISTWGSFSKQNYRLDL